MRSLADQVIEYLQWRSGDTENSYTMAMLASEVAARQKSNDQPCKRQDIENLVKLGIKSPRYLLELAQAMGTTAETLKAGAFYPGTVSASVPQALAAAKHSIGVPTSAQSISLGAALEAIAITLMKADASTRELAAGMLSNLARNPENHARVSLGLLAILGNGGPQFETTQVTQPHTEP